MLGCTIADSIGSRGGTCFSPLESKAKSDSRAKRTFDLERKNGVGGVLGDFWGMVFAVEGTIIVPEDERWES